MSTEAVLQNSGRYVGGVPQKPPVQGGSGRQYWTIRDALAGEAALAVTVAGVVPQAGTQAGITVFQAGQSAVNDFYLDQYVLNTDTTPTNGLVSQYARISDYVGASRTATLDKPWDFSGESTVSIIQPARIWLNGDVEEDVTITIPLELNLQGHRIRGKIDITGGGFCWIRGGSGYVTNGIQKTDFGLLKVDDCAVSRRDATIYALLMTNGSDLGRTELSDCRFSGRVAGRRGFSGWSIVNCKNVGVIDASAFGNYPHALVESVAGVAIALSALDATIDSEFGGTVIYDENSITGATAYVDINANVWPPDYPFQLDNTPIQFSVIALVGAATWTSTLTAGVIRVVASGYVASAPTKNQAVPTLVRADNFTGTATITINTSPVWTFQNSGNISLLLIQGSTTMSGAITITGTGTQNFNCLQQSGNFRVIFVFSDMSGTVTVSTGLIRSDGSVVVGMQFNAAITGNPTVSISASILTTLSQNLRLFIPNNSGITTGSYTVSGDSFGGTSALNNAFLFSSSVVAGGTWLVSGNLRTTCLWTTNATALSFIAFSATTGTLTLSGAVSIGMVGVPSITFDLVNHTGTGGTAEISGAVALTGINATSTFRLVRASVAGGTAKLSSTVKISYCLIGGVATVSTNVAGSNTTGPTSLIWEYCTFASTLVTQSGAGTLTWTGATIQYFHCHIEGLYTVVYTAFAVHEAFHCRFNGGSSNKSISGSGTRPTTLRYWSCSFAQRYDDILPEVINVYDILPAQAALVQGQPVIVNGANQYQVAVAASILDGVLLAAAGGAGTFAVCVRQGRVFAACKAGTVNGDNLALDLVTPTQLNQAAFTPGQNSGTALENVGTTVANKSYAAINQR